VSTFAPAQAPPSSPNTAPPPPDLRPRPEPATLYATTLIAPRGAAVNIKAATRTTGAELRSAGVSAIAPSPVTTTLINGVWLRAPTATNVVLTTM